jgi:hypothetical protein
MMKRLKLFVMFKHKKNKNALEAMAPLLLPTYNNNVKG